ncbi:MAG: alpha/beta hydrolase [Acidimicrobiales bacterium]
MLATIEEPTLVITGDRDEVADLGQAERLLSAIPGAELAIVPGRGHGAADGPSPGIWCSTSSIAGSGSRSFPSRSIEG